MAQLGRGEVRSRFGDRECAGHGHQLRTQSDISVVARQTMCAVPAPAGALAGSALYYEYPAQ